MVDGSPLAKPTRRITLATMFVGAAMLGRRRSFAGLRSAALLQTMPSALTMATGSPGCGFATYGPALAMAMQRKTHVPVSFCVSGGIVANILLLEQRAVDIGFASLVVASEAWTGTSTWTGGLAMHGFRALFPVCDQQLQVVTPEDRGIKRLVDLDNACIGIGPAGSASAVLVPDLLRALRIAPRRYQEGGFAEQIADLASGALDACAFFGVSPLRAIESAALSGRYTLIGCNDAEAKAMCRSVTGLTPSIIARSTLPALSESVATVGSAALALSRADLPDSLAASLTNAALANQRALLSAAGVVVPPPSDWLHAVDAVEIHPGAAPELRKHGFVVPEQLVKS